MSQKVPHITLSAHVTMIPTDASPTQERKKEIKGKKESERKTEKKETDISHKSTCQVGQLKPKAQPKKKK